MEEGTKTKKTIFVGNIAGDVDEAVLLETFATFGAFFSLLSPPLPKLAPLSGDVIEVQIPPASTDSNRQTGERAVIESDFIP